MIIGSSSLWLSSIKDIDEELMECIKRVWPSVIRRCSQTEKEDTITERLVDLLRKDKSLCKLGFLNIHYKLREEDTLGDFTTKGILDMALFLDQNYDRYIAYECKRLNRIDSQGKRTGSQAGTYVEDGVSRYVNAKYSKKLPYGCMIGYVMDGDLAFALKQLVAAINKRRSLIKLSSGQLFISSDNSTAFETSHSRAYDNSSITVRHRLFSMI